jgi:hypothetical protein
MGKLVLHHFFWGVLLKFPNPLISHKGRLMMLEDFNDLVSSGRTYNSATQRARRGAMICTAGRIRFEECKRDIQQLLLLRVQHNILFSSFFFVCPFFAGGKSLHQNWACLRIGYSPKFDG